MHVCALCLSTVYLLSAMHSARFTHSIYRKYIFVVVVHLQVNQYAFAKKLACMTGGVYRSISDSDNPVEILTRYYEPLANGMRREQVTWTEPYLDASGAGQNLMPGFT